MTMAEVELFFNRRESLPNSETPPLTDSVAKVFTAGILMLAARRLIIKQSAVSQQEINEHTPFLEKLSYAGVGICAFEG